MRPSIFGFGELVLHHIFDSTPRGPVYCGSAGGGSVWNVLANLAAHGAWTVATGVMGDDIYGHLALDSLRNGGTQVSGVHAIAQRRTRLIYEIYSSSTTKTYPLHRFTDRCLFCKRRYPTESFAHSREIATARLSLTQGDFLCVDRLSEDRVALAKQAKIAGVCTVLDYGQTSFLRYKPVAQIFRQMSVFDVLLLSGPVARSITKRAVLDSTTVLAQLLLEAGSALVIISDGPAGATFSVDLADGFHSAYLPPSNSPIIDDAGAGDALLAAVLLDLSQQPILRLADLTRLVEHAALALPQVLGGLGARGHLPFAPVSHPELDRWKGRLIEESWTQSPKTACPFCSLSPVPERVGVPRNGHRRPGGIQTLSYLKMRALFTIERTDALRKCDEILKSAGSTYVIGTGGSFSAALFISNIINEFGVGFAQATRPHDYVRTGKPTDTVVVVSYSGRTPDCGSAIAKALERDVGRVVLVTAAKDPALSRYLRSCDLIVSYGGNGVKERGFVSIAGTVMPCVLWATVCLGGAALGRLHRWSREDWLADIDTEPILQAFRDNRPIDVLATAHAWPAAVDLESKCMEGDLGRASLHEAKDFSHGRFIHVFNRCHDFCAVVLRTADTDAYEDFLTDTLKEEGPVVEIKAESSGALGGLELLIAMQYLAQHIGMSEDKDISRPRHLPKSGLHLYHWQPGLKPS